MSTTDWSEKAHEAAFNVVEEFHLDGKGTFEKIAQIILAALLTETEVKK